MENKIHPVSYTHLADITFSNVRVNDTYLSDSDTVVNRFRVENGEVSTVTQDYLK